MIATVAAATNDQPPPSQQATDEGACATGQRSTSAATPAHAAAGQDAQRPSTPPPGAAQETAAAPAAGAIGGETAPTTGDEAAVARADTTPREPTRPLLPTTGVVADSVSAGTVARRGVIGPADPATDATTRATPPPVALRVLGEITVTARGALLVFQPREQRLLAALAVMGPQPVHPDRLVEALFPDDDPLTGQDKLQHSITDIRLVLKKAGVRVRRAGVVRYSLGGYTLDPALIGVDAYRFRDLLRRVQTAERTERFALLAEAVDIYTGDLCGDQTLDWLEGYRYAWRKEYLEALYELALYYDHEGNDPLGALRVARRLAAEEPLQDHYHQMVLELIAATGDLDALDTYVDEMRAVFAAHDIEVDGYTNALHERLRARLLRERGRTDGRCDDADGLTGRTGKLIR